MAEPIEVDPGVRIPASALDVRAVRSSGPGGQNVNKVASCIEIFVTLSGIDGLTDDARARLVRLAGKRVDGEGRLRVTSQESRDQRRNLDTAREKVRALVAASLVVPKRRRPTKPGAGVREARLRGKRRDAKVKSTRSRPGLED